MQRWKLRLLVIAGIVAAISAVTSLLLWNPVGLCVVGVITGLLIAVFPSIPWFLPPLVIWLLLFTAFAILITVILQKAKISIV